MGLHVAFFLQLDKTISNSNPVLQCLCICPSLVSSVDLIGLLSVLSSNIVMKILNHIKLKTGSWRGQFDKSLQFDSEPLIIILYVVFQPVMLTKQQ